MSGVMVLQRHVFFFEIKKKNSATLKVLITVLKYLFKLIVKSISKFPYSAVATSFFLVEVGLWGGIIDLPRSARTGEGGVY